MKLAEEAQVHWQQKVEKEAEAMLADAKKKANALIAESEQSVKKAALLVENERKQLLAQAEQELKEKQREMGRLEAVQQAFAEQMLELSQQTIDQLAKWKKDVPPVAPVKSVQVKAKPASKVVKPVAKPKAVAKKKAKPVSKPAKSNHLDVSTIEDDGLPTLNKVLEAYAKSSGPRGKVGDLN
jgi:uncharacterized protein with von Willebrand factor type A (vWA) domain